MEDEWGGREREQTGKRRGRQTQRDRWTQRETWSQREMQTHVHILHTQRKIS